MSNEAVALTIWVPFGNNSLLLRHFILKFPCRHLSLQIAIKSNTMTSLLRDSPAVQCKAVLSYICNKDGDLYFKCPNSFCQNGYQHDRDLKSSRGVGQHFRRQPGCESVFKRMLQNAVKEALSIDADERESKKPKTTSHPEDIFVAGNSYMSDQLSSNSSDTDSCDSIAFLKGEDLSGLLLSFPGNDHNLNHGTNDPCDQDDDSSGFIDTTGLMESLFADVSYFLPQDNDDENANPSPDEVLQDYQPCYTGAWEKASQRRKQFLEEKNMSTQDMFMLRLLHLLRGIPRLSLFNDIVQWAVNATMAGAFKITNDTKIPNRESFIKQMMIRKSMEGLTPITETVKLPKAKMSIAVTRFDPEETLISLLNDKNLMSKDKLSLCKEGDPFAPPNVKFPIDDLGVHSWRLECWQNVSHESP